MTKTISRYFYRDLLAAAVLPEIYNLHGGVNMEQIAAYSYGMARPKLEEREKHE